MTGLPAPVETAIDALSLDNWRERKEAVTRLRALSAALDSRELDGLAHRLLGLLTTTDVIHARAGAHEVLVGLGKMVVPPLRELVGQASPGARLLVDLLAQVGGEQDAELLTGMLLDEGCDPNLRASAATALGTLGGDAAQTALTRLLEDESEMLRTYALDGLQDLGAEVSVGSLQPLIVNPITRKGATALLARAGEDAIPLLSGLLSDAMAGVRAVACVAMARLDTSLARGGRPELVRRVVADLPDAARVRVRELIGHRNAEVSSAAIKLAAMCRDVQALPALLEVMDDPAAQEHAMEMVMDLGEVANPALVEVSARADVGRREHLYRLVGALRVDVVDPRLQTLLTEGLEDAGEETACAAAEALRFVGGRSSMGALYRTMASEGPLGELAADSLADIVARIGGSRHDDLNLLVGAAWPQQGALARNLSRVAGKLGSIGYVPSLVSVLGSTDVGVRVAAATALGMVPGDHEGVGALSFALADEEPQVRAAACRSLGQLRAPHSVQSLLSATSDPSPLVRAAAVQALVAVDNPIALARYREIVADDPVPTVVVQAIAGVGTSGSEQDLTMLMSLCTSQDHEVVKAAARALNRFSAHRATAALLGLLGHDRWDVRWAAAEVLAARGDATALPSLQYTLKNETDDLVKQVVRDGIAKLEGRTPPET